MRNAAAQFDDDFDLVEPKRKKASRRAASGKRGKKAKRFGFNIDLKRIARYAAIGMSGTVAIGIMVNALMMQKGHHPAPLFGKSIPLGTPVVPVPPPPPVRKVEAPAPQPAAVEAMEAPPAPMTKTKQAADAAEHANGPRPDPIARLLQGGAPVPAAGKASTSMKGPASLKGPAPEKVEPKTVFNVQRALVKLGFVMKPNGHFGPQTKKAIEMFEKDRHLPVKGDLSPRLLKILSAESGLKI